MKKSLVVSALLLAVLSTPAEALDLRPSAWCGWFARHFLVERDPGVGFNLAARWFGYGRHHVGPCVGCMAVWPHHVGKIVRDRGRARGHRWVVRSGNDGGRVRDRARSVAGARFRLG